MHFTDAAGRWFQSVEKKIRAASWSEFCKLVLDRFGRDQHELLVRQLFHIKQQGSVADYITQFSSLMDQLLAYEGHTDPLHYTMKFIDGLKPEFKSAILLQRPSTLDTAFVLAQLQEEVVNLSRRRSMGAMNFSIHLSILSSLLCPCHYHREGRLNLLLIKLMTVVLLKRLKPKPMKTNGDH